MVERKRMYALVSFFVFLEGVKGGEIESILLQVQWEWQESTSTWRHYGRIESRIIEVRNHEKKNPVTLHNELVIIVIIMFVCLF